MTIITDTTVTTFISEQLGSKLVVTDNKTTQQIGEVVTDFTQSPYIAAREVGFAAWNLRPNHIHHVFFDGINVDEYCSPGVYQPTGLGKPGGTILPTSTPGTELYTDNYGMLTGVFSIPDERFKVGDRTLEIADVDSLTLGTDAIVSKAAAIFTSSNISVTKKMLTLTTINPIVKVVDDSKRIVTTDTKVKVTDVPDDVIYNIVYSWYEPIAQGLSINTPGGQAGIFATKLDLYFKQKSKIATHGVTVYLCEVNNGYPDGNAILPYSVKHLDNVDINTDADYPNNPKATTVTTFTFDSPVFMANGKEYAFIVKPDASDPDFHVYSAELGNLDISTGAQVSSIPIVGTAFYGATMTQWTALQKEYIKFTLHRAVFDTNDGYAYFNNTDAEYIPMMNLSYVNGASTLSPGQYVFAAANEVSNSIGGSVDDTTYAVLAQFSASVPGLYCEQSTGTFPAGNGFVQIHKLVYDTNGDVILQPNNVTLVAYGNTYPMFSPRMNAIVPQFSTISPAGTKLSYGFKGTSNAYAVDSSYIEVVPGVETELLDYERLIVSKSTEATEMSGDKSFEYRVKLSTDNTFTSPVVDTVIQNQLVIANDANPIESIYEEFFDSSPTRSKYISKVVTLASGQDAQDLQITLSAHKPPSTQIQVWVKYLNAEDSESMAQKTWTPMRDLNSTTFCDPLDPSDLKEFTYSTPFSYPMIPTTGTVTATDSSTTVSGDGTTTTFGTDVNVGFYVNMLANSTWSEVSRQVVSITDANTLVLSAPFTNNYTSNTLYIVPPPTTAYKSTNNAIELTGTVTTNTLNTTITGASTNFTGQLKPGSIISINGDKQSVVSVTNSTSLTVGTPWSSYVSGATGYSIIPAGVTYYNSSNTVFSTFNQFQIKIVLMTDDSSKVPIIDDLRALALQL